MPFQKICRISLAASFAALIFSCLLATSRTMEAQTYTVIHYFHGFSDGGDPLSGLTIDSGGNFYGTTSVGGRGSGTVFRLQQRGSGWTLSTLFSFNGTDGTGPEAPVVFGPDGRLYGTTVAGGIQGECKFGPVQGCGTVFALRPPATVCGSVNCQWTIDTLYAFPGGDVGGTPAQGAVVFDPSGNLYSTMYQDQNGNMCEDDGPCGAVYELSPGSGGWNESQIADFRGLGLGIEPAGGVIIDGSGNLYGATDSTVYMLVPDNGGWRPVVLYRFSGGAAGSDPAGGLIRDSAGNLYGTTSGGGSGNGGTVFELELSGGNWTLTVLYSLVGNFGGPMAPLTMDAAGNLYGTTYMGGAHNYGSVFKLTHSNGSWTYTSLHDFTGGIDGGYPVSSLVFDAAGNLYGTARLGGTGYGVVFEITP